MIKEIPSGFNGLEHIAASVILLNKRYKMVYANPSFEVLFGVSSTKIFNHHLSEIFFNCEVLLLAIENSVKNNSPFREHEFSITSQNHKSHAVTCTVTPVKIQDAIILLEFQQMDQQLRIAREERILIQQQANSELLRNLAHEIRNPLGGLRGAAQLLEHELPQPSLREYTQVIIKEADRLQDLMDRLLVPHRMPQYEPTNIHEVLERVRSLLLAESPNNIQVSRDYDTSLPDLTGDREKLIQAVLNVARNAVHALKESGIGNAKVTFRTRSERQVTLSKKRYRVAIKLEIIDNGPGIPPSMMDKIFYPLVTGHASGTGLGLALAQTFITQHHGMIDCDSKPGRTCFTMLIPIESSVIKHSSTQP